MVNLLLTSGTRKLNSNPKITETIYCRIQVVQDEVTLITEDTLLSGTAPDNDRNYIPVIIGQSGTNNYQCTIKYDNPYWVAYSSFAQILTIVFYKVK